MSVSPEMASEMARAEREEELWMRSKVVEGGRRRLVRKAEDEVDVPVNGERSAYGMLLRRVAHFPYLNHYWEDVFAILIDQTLYVCPAGDTRRGTPVYLPTTNVFIKEKRICRTSRGRPGPAPQYPPRAFYVILKPNKFTKITLRADNQDSAIYWSKALIDRNPEPIRLANPSHSSLNDLTGALSVPHPHQDVPKSSSSVGGGSSTSSLRPRSISTKTTPTSTPAFRHRHTASPLSFATQRPTPVSSLDGITDEGSLTLKPSMFHADEDPIENPKEDGKAALEESPEAEERAKSTAVKQDDDSREIGEHKLPHEVKSQVVQVPGKGTLRFRFIPNDSSEAHPRHHILSYSFSTTEQPSYQDIRWNHATESLGKTDAPQASKAQEESRCTLVQAGTPTSTFTPLGRIGGGRAIHPASHSVPEYTPTPTSNTSQPFLPITPTSSTLKDPRSSRPSSVSSNPSLGYYIASPLPTNTSHNLRGHSASTASSRWSHLHSPHPVPCSCCPSRPSLTG